MLRQMLKKYFLGKKKFQVFFEKLNETSLMGMNFGLGGDVRTSGEVGAAINLLRGRKTPCVIFDVGAHNGEYSLKLLEVFKNARFYCFEPSSASFMKLKENCGKMENIRLYQLGLGGKNETFDLFSDSQGSVFASVYEKAPGLRREGIYCEKIVVRRLDDFCLENKISHIDLLKVDVEGGEFSVLTGARQMLDSQSIDFIQFEFGGCDIGARVFFRDFFMLLNPGYRIYRILRDGLIFVEKYKETHEVFLTTNYAAVSRNFPAEN